MAIIDSYRYYSNGSFVRTARKRSRWNPDDTIVVPSGRNIVGSYTDSTVLRFGSTQTTVDYLNAWSEARELQREHGLKGMDKYTSRFDYGSNFYSRSVTVPPPAELTVRRVSSGSLLDSWTGYVFPHADCRTLAIKSTQDAKPWPVGKGDEGVPDMLTLRGVGSQGIAKTIPSIPTVSIAQSLGELREGLPKITARAIRKADPGGEFLNYQFGIRPLIKDLQKIADSSKNYDEYVAKWNHNNGKLVHRKWFLGSYNDITFTDLTAGVPAPQEGGARHWFSGSRTIVDSYYTDVWFSACYRVELPPVSSGFFKRLKDFTRTFGIVPTVETAWQLFPWTWLLDWVINFDDVITNLSYLGRSGVNLHYAYVMAETKSNRSWTYNGTYRPLYESGALQPPVPLELSWTHRTTTKQRVKASPFGFGVGLDFKFSPDQLAILSALGLSRLKQ